MKNFILVTTMVSLSLGLAACEPKVEDASSSGQHLYITSGSCYVGSGLTAETPSRTLSKLNLSTGVVDEILMDYNTVNSSDRPQSVIDYDSQNLLVLVENPVSFNRRIDLVKKKGGNSFATYLTDSTILTTTAGHVVRDMVRTPDGGILISKSAAAEKLSSSKGRVTVGANAFINAPTGGTCGTTNNTLISNTLISAVVALPNSKYIFAHAAATPNNRVVFINSTNGYSASADCSSAVTAPATTTFPTAMIYISSETTANTGYLLVSYSSSTAAQDYIYAYDVNETSGTITGATKAYENSSVLRGISAMAYDSTTGSIFVANGSTTLANGIERFTFDPTTKTLTRVGSVPFAGTSLYTKCITGMTVAN
ncbi:lactonase family protein [Bdellovibrio sp. SKB1291214]|uniref:hypothetical protein n=1 Tax=Bdellovibrio sp. SKB1291214 TaxID=1732569 RepID=UPI00223FA2B8|nr:hypothetical protein [Bdellovibrio sp. SKB1291214]UYL10228.1 lactonase family protein [Bdellovibrio sp. SKB1291214]